jgi:LDH2 family malate/lactate/ureidoglycolate dehydrogenase
MVVDVKRFVGVERFAARLQQMAARVRRMQPLEGGEGSVMVPGDPEKRCHRIRSRQGIPMDEDKFAEFLAVSPDFSEAVRAS